MTNRDAGAAPAPSGCDAAVKDRRTYIIILYIYIYIYIYISHHFYYY